MEKKLDDLIKTVTELKTSNGKIISSLNSQNEKFNRIEKRLDDLFRNFTILMEENRDLKLKITNIEERILCIENNKTQTQHSSFEHDVIEELMDRQVRSNNVILFNLPENENDNDLENIKYIFTDLNETIGDFKFSRLGKTKSTIHDRPRPIKIRLNEQSDVFSILRAQKILKNSTKWSNIHFSSDKTTKQRNEMANLRNTLQSRREKGYGHSTPVTIGGKAFCMAYAMVGIPLGLIMFQSIGERLNKFASVVIRRAKQYLKCKKEEATEMNLMFATGLLSSVIITTGAAVFSKYEGWSYFDSFYYCFVTLTTIGFGDYVALQNDQALTTMPGYVALSLVFILFGLAVVAASINLLVLRFMTMNAEEVRREDNELQGVSQHVITVDGEAVTSVNGKLLAGHTVGRDAGDDVDQVSVCSCTCVGPVQYDYNRDIRPAERAAANAAAAAAVVYNSPPTEQPLLSMKRVSI